MPKFDCSRKLSDNFLPWTKNREIFSTQSQLPYQTVASYPAIQNKTHYTTEERLMTIVRKKFP